MAEGDRLAAQEKIETALNAGWTLIDTADIHGFDGQEGFGRAETLLGEVPAQNPALRQKMVLATRGGIRQIRAWIDAKGATLTDINLTVTLWGESFTRTD